ncbi:DUF4145 domain-containing protein [Leptospira sp. 201903070]|uniref:DUF4145 domain-containing protein n=1 Tax=Leptospira ainlahdjerensis TaxID=2810033 RepID=A0ABS2UCS1_9LEPT|nr:DUF4145 domain-containing protein [Leptospira ainlahdjerensis]MBM9578176.1 DUF4145 domain-containing protein [Leptospira ainlahdjerensis]
MNDSFSWTCPYCRRDATITHPQYSSEFHFFEHNSKYKKQCLMTLIIVCPNINCRETSIEVQLFNAKLGPPRYENEIVGEPLLSWHLKPESNFIVLPNYIPEAVRQDYEEASRILSLSPKASATLSRRCLQGMVRDFWSITKSRLVDEINELQGRIDPLIWDAIDGLRKLGNIGAHMEKDINVIVEVDPNEAALLISLLETLFKEWYINRHNRKEQLQAIITAASTKKT